MKHTSFLQPDEQLCALCPASCLQSDGLESSQEPIVLVSLQLCPNVRSTTASSQPTAGQSMAQATRSFIQGQCRPAFVYNFCFLLSAGSGPPVTKVTL